MTNLDTLVEEFINGGMNTNMSPSNMNRILVTYFGYTLAKDAGSHRKYKKKGHRGINIIIGDDTGSTRVQPYSVREARNILEAEGLLWK